jgi:hypothetical protein
VRPVTTELAVSRTYPLGVGDAFDAVLPMPLPDLFCHWFGPLPPIRATRQSGVWSTAGQERVVELTGPGSMTETLTEVERPTHFAYRLTAIKGPLGALVDSVDGRWTFAPAGTGVRITWSWRVAPRGALGRASMPLFARLWRGYARRALAELEVRLVG